MHSAAGSLPAFDEDIVRSIDQPQVPPRRVASGDADAVEPEDPAACVLRLEVIGPGCGQL